MAINFTDSPSNGATQTISGRTYTYNSAKNKWDTTATEVAGPTATVYATVNDLPGSATAGDQAFVSGTNRLYIWNGSGWYNIALINNTPSWTTQPNSNYTLAIDGTATTITIVATDPEGLPITYSIASDTSGSIATVTQGTGADVNTFTITPSTSSADAGTFSLTFRASDGINVASAVSSFTLAFQVTNQNYTTALITTAGNAGINNSFTDSSSNSHTITATGDVTQNSFSPYRHGGYSHYYTASLNEYHTATISAIGTSWTIEGWFYRTGGVSSGLQVAGHIGAINAANGCSWGIEDTQIVFRANGTTDSTFSVSSTTYRWIHLAFDYDGTTLTCYVNGVSIGTASRTLNITETLLNIGYYNNSYTYEGYIKDMRISTTRRYTAAFTALTEEYGTDSNTDILVRNQPFIRDISSNSRTITASGSNGTHSQKPFAPFDAQEYSAGSHGGSAHFDGSGDYLSVPSSAEFNVSSGAWTAEGWIYSTDWATPISQHLFSAFYDSNNRSSLYYNSTGSNITYWSNGSARIEGGALSPNQWYHLAVTSDGTTTTLYVNGVSKGTTTYTQANYNMAIYVGTAWNSGGSTNGYMDGYISDFRFVKGTQVYTAAFTPPTAPLTAVTNTSLLLSMQGAKIFDKAQGSAEKLTLAGNTTASTAAYKYLPTSMYFDGNGDYIQLEGMDDRYYDDFTVEGWYKFNTYNNSSGANTRLFASRQGGNHADNLQIIVAKATDSGSAGAGTISVYTNAYQITGSAITVADNNWHHVAVSRQGTSLKLFVDGTHTGSTKTTSQSFLFWDTRLATRDNTADATSKYTGYMSDVRITKGLARYTANFTPPAAALSG